MVDYLSKDSVEMGELVDLYESVGWTAYTEDLSILEGVIDGAQHYIAARFEGRLVGLVRVIGDGVYIAYIQDLLVHKDYQGQGIGRQLMLLILEEVSYAKQILLTTEDKASTKRFYESLGMTNYHDFNTVGYAIYNN